MVFVESYHNKRIKRLLADKRKELEAICKKTASSYYFCEPVARAAADNLAASSIGSYHRLDIEVKESPKYGRGRPAADKPRLAKGYEYSLDKPGYQNIRRAGGSGSAAA